MVVGSVCRGVITAPGVRWPRPLPLAWPVAPGLKRPCVTPRNTLGIACAMASGGEWGSSFRIVCSGRVASRTPRRSVVVTDLSGLYAITPDGLPRVDLLARVEAALAGGCRWLQLRD